MASSRATTWHCLLALFLLSSAAYGQLSPSFYARSCPTLQLIVRATMIRALLAERRMGASLLRFHFHDCFVQGCDGSILLDDIPGSFTGEKTALGNVNSVRGFEVIDQIKRNVELVCPGVVSCADILTLAARDGTVLLGGPSWNVPLGRRDSTNANRDEANNDLPPPSSDLGALIAAFRKKNLNPTDLTALSGGHTIGFSQCRNFRDHIYNASANIDPAFATLRKRTCPAAAPSGDTNLAPFDVQTQLAFDNAYYRNLVARRGLLRSDQELLNGGSQDALVRQYSTNPALFSADFVTAMIKMGNPPHLDFANRPCPPPRSPPMTRRRRRPPSSPPLLAGPPSAALPPLLRSCLHRRMPCFLHSLLGRGTRTATLSSPSRRPNHGVAGTQQSACELMSSSAIR